MAPGVRPVAAAISRTLLPSASPTAIRLSIGFSPRVLATRSGSIRCWLLGSDNQDQRGHVARAVVRLGHGDGFDMHHERRGTGRAGQQHRPADRDGPGGRQRAGQEPVQTGPIGRLPRPQHPLPVRQPRATSQEATGAVIDLQDLPAPVQVDDPNPGILQQGGRGRGPRPGPDQRLPDAHKVPDLGQQPLQQRDRRRPPALRGHRIAETPGYVGAIRPVQAHVQALLIVAPTQEVVVAR